MTKQEFLLLEKIFSAEISKTKFQSKSKLAKKLIDDGYIEEITQVMLFQPLGKAEFKYLKLTILGHMNFCYECDKYYDDEGNPK